MPYRPYAQRPGRLTVQVLVDLVMLAWIAFWIWAAVQLHHAVVALGTVGFKLRDSAGGVASGLRDAGGNVAKVPLVGNPLSHPLTSAGGSAQGVANAGQQLGDDITGFALPLAIALALLAILPLAMPWLALRWRYATRAGATEGLANTPGGTRLLALRAMTNQPTRRLIKIDPDPVAAWDRYDPQVTQALAALELRRLGLRRGRTALPIATAR